MVQKENASKTREKKTGNHFTIETAIRNRFKRNRPNGNCIWTQIIVCGHEKGQKIHFEHTWVEPERAMSSSIPCTLSFHIEIRSVVCNDAKWTQSHCIDWRRAQSKISVDAESIPISTYYDMQTCRFAALKPFGRDKCISLSHRSHLPSWHALQFSRVRPYEPQTFLPFIVRQNIPFNCLNIQNSVHWYSFPHHCIARSIAAEFNHGTYF